MKWTAEDVVAGLRRLYGIETSDLHQEEWSMFEQVPLHSRKTLPGTDGEPREVPGYWGINERTIDVLTVRNWGGGKAGHRRDAIEVKVSVSDYRNETSEKRAPAEASASERLGASGA